MNTSGQQNFSERLSLEVIFTNGTSALAGKGLKEEWSVVRGSLAWNHEVQDLNCGHQREMVFNDRFICFDLAPNHPYFFDYLLSVSCAFQVWMKTT